MYWSSRSWCWSKAETGEATYRSSLILAAAGPAEPVAEDRAEAGGTPVSESKTSVPEGPSAVKASLSSRKAHLSVSRVEPWSVMKFSFVVSLVCFIILFVAIAVIYATLSMLGVFDDLFLRPVPNKCSAICIEVDDGGHQLVAVRVRDYPRDSVFADRDKAVGGSQVNSYDFGHECGPTLP